MQPRLFLIAATALLLQVAPSWSASEAAKSSALQQGGDDRPEGVRGDPAHLCPLPWSRLYRRYLRPYSRRWNIFLCFIRDPRLIRGR